MCKKSILIFTLCLCLPAITSYGQARIEQTEARPMRMLMEEILYVADSKEEILAWGEQALKRTCHAIEYEHGGNQAIVMYHDIGSGRSSQSIYVFGKSKNMKKWRLILYRPTTTRVSTRQENGKLIFANEATDTKDVILKQSLEVLHVGPTEKKPMVPFCTASNKETILEWGKQHNCRNFEYNHGDNQIIVLLENVRTGVVHENISIFGLRTLASGEKAWYLVLYRPTNTKVKICQENSKLIFSKESTDTDEVILEQSLETLWPIATYSR